MTEIGSFQIDLQTRNLLQNGEVVDVGSRAFDILAALVSAAGRLVTKDEMMNTIWPDTVVEENNLHVHLSALRKKLGRDRDLILTVPGRGYRLVQRQKNAGPNETCSHATGRGRLPSATPRLFGRDCAVKLICSMLTDTHVLTLVGAGGIGKTTLAIEAARHTSSDFAETICLVELATLTTQEAILGAIIEGCGLTLPGPTADIAQVTAALGHRRRLLVLDNAEHLIAAVAQVVDALVAGNDMLRVLVTSREPLRIMPETLFKVDPLGVPPAGSSDAEILQSSAVNLFLLRADSLQCRFHVDSNEMQLIGEICRRLDGLPLAIELAAARVVTLGLEEVRRRLDDRMALLAGGYRTALPRHQTLRATFDWSFALLDIRTKSLFRRLAIFGSRFSFESMCAVVCDREYSVTNAIDGINELVSKSLINVEFEGPVAKYRLSESTRAYAMEKLHAEGELQAMTSSHARYLSGLFESRKIGDLHDETHKSSDPQQTLDDALLALDWAFSVDGDLRIGVELTSNLIGALLDAGMIEECCTRASLAADALETLPAGSLDATSELRVRATLASALPYVRGPILRPAELWPDILELATISDDQVLQTHAL